MKEIFLLLIVSIVVNSYLRAQRVELMTKGTITSIRGLSVVNDEQVWVSGSNGHVGKSLDGGKSWKWMIVKGFEKTDFRDIEAFDENTAVIIAIAEPAYILKTTDGGESWKTVYENKTAGMFLDAMDFSDNRRGVVIGDPINGKFFIARTFDQGESWKEIPPIDAPASDSGEACFASSGTNIRLLYGGEYCFVSGGSNARYFTSAFSAKLHTAGGGKSNGANSIAVWERKQSERKKNMVVAGGDFTRDTSTANNCFISSDNGRSWKAPAISPHGYRSCVEFINRSQLISCGTSGVDLSMNGGMNWTLISSESFHVCRKAKNGKTVFLAGINGKVGKLVVK